MRHLLTFVILSFACYRITRLAILDTIFDVPRDWVHAWLLNGNDDARWRKWWLKIPAAFIPLWAAALGGGILLTDHRAWGVCALVAGVLWVLFVHLVFAEGPTWIGHKIEEMISCPYCLSVWVGLGLMLLTWPHRPIPLPVFYFLALSTGGMVFYQYIDFEPEEDNELD